MTTGLNLAVFPIIMIGASVLAFVAYILFYMLGINKTVRHSVENDEFPGLEEKPKKRLRMPGTGSAGFTILFIATVACIVVCFVQLSSLKKEFQNLSDNYSCQMYAFQEQLQSTYNDIEEMLNEKNSLFTSIDVKSGAYDKKTQRGEFIITVVPKRLTDDMKMTFNFRNEKFEGIRVDSEFVFTCRLDVLTLYADETDESESYISVTAANETKNEKTPTVDAELCYARFIPQIYVSYVYPHFSSGRLSFELEENLCFDVNFETDIGFKTAKICFEKNGRLFKTLDVSSYFDVSEPTKEISVPTPSTKDFPGFSNGDELKIYLVARDEAGITHTCYMAYGKCEDGAYVPYEFADEYNELLSVE